MSFQAGLSGLSASSEALDVISNNVANAGTKGFKANTISFADVVAAPMSNSGAGFGGIGTRVSATNKSFTQGSVTSTSKPLDTAINGDGFFMVNQNGSTFYTRDGEFSRDSNGYLVTSSGSKVMGFPAVNGLAPTSGSPSPLMLSDATLSPKQTTSASVSANLDSRASAPSSVFSPADSTSWNGSTSVSVYDSLGNSHDLGLYFVKTGTGTWDVQGTMDGSQTGSLGTLNFTSIGLTTGTSNFNVSLPVSSGASAPLSVSLDLSSTTQFGSSTSVSAVSQDGYAPGSPSGFSVGADGVISGTYSNGKTMPIGRLALANFSAPEGLSSQGNNLYAETTASGQPVVGAPGTGRLGQVVPGAVEESNVDLTNELVNMIQAQRNYQANAQSIKTQDQIMQTLVNLR